MTTTLTAQRAQTQTDEWTRTAAAAQRHRRDGGEVRTGGPIRRLAARYWPGERTRHQHKTHRARWRTRRV